MQHHLEQDGDLDSAIDVGGDISGAEKGYPHENSREMSEEVDKTHTPKQLEQLELLPGCISVDLFPKFPGLSTWHVARLHVRAFRLDCFDLLACDA